AFGGVYRARPLSLCESRKTVGSPSGLKGLNTFNGVLHLSAPDQLSPKCLAHSLPKNIWLQVIVGTVIECSRNRRHRHRPKPHSVVLGNVAVVEYGTLRGLDAPRPPRQRERHVGTRWQQI